MKFWNKWDQFWFTKNNLRFVSLFRFVLGISLLAMYFIRFLDRDILLYENGLLGADLAKQYLPEFYQTTISWVPSTDTAVFYTNIVYLIGLLFWVLGLFDRSLTWLLLMLHLALMRRNFTVIYGADLIATFWLFYLSFIRHGRYFSMRNLWRDKTYDFKTFVGWSKEWSADFVSSMGTRLIQVQLCVIYAYTGLDKMKGASWWDGSAVWKVLGNAQLAPLDFSFVSHFPLFVAVTTFATVIFEVYFPFAVWTQLRKPWLAVGLIFHGGAAFMMGLPFFSLVMVSSYLVFLG